MDTLSPDKAALIKAARVMGGQAALAKALGYQDRRNVAPWFTTARPIPAEHCLVIERETRALNDPVLCEELRPDVAWDVLRAQVATEAPRAAA